MGMTKEEFRAIREKLNLSRSEMAKRLGGYQTRTIVSWEYGERKVPKAVIKLLTLMEQI